MHRENKNTKTIGEARGLTVTRGTQRYACQEGKWCALLARPSQPEEHLQPQGRQSDISHGQERDLLTFAQNEGQIASKVRPPHHEFDMADCWSQRTGELTVWNRPSALFPARTAASPF